MLSDTDHFQLGPVIKLHGLTERILVDKQAESYFLVQHDNLGLLLRVYPVNGPSLYNLWGINLIPDRAHGIQGDAGLTPSVFQRHRLAALDTVQRQPGKHFSHCRIDNLIISFQQGRTVLILFRPGLAATVL